MFRPRKVLLALFTALIAAIFIKFRGSNHETSLPKPPIQNPITEPYIAPFSNPNAPLEDDIVKDTYVVHLAPGHSISNHSSAISYDITTHTTRILTKPKNKIIYLASRVPHLLLIKIRADPKVELVEYEYVGTPSSPVYLAPLHNCDLPPGEVVKGAYQVLLAPDHSFEKHSEAVGRDMESVLVNKYNFHTNKWVYSVQGVGREFLRGIRGDKGVEMVVCEGTKKRETEGDLRPK